MHNTTPYGVRRAHSFDSYDNLDKWQAIREHRMQFLSTRAKFDNKLPPSEPPPPPPRHASKFKVTSPSSTSSSVSPVSQLIQNFTEELRSMSTHDKTIENSHFQDENKYDTQFSSVTKNTATQSHLKNKTTTFDPTNTNNGNFEQHKFKALQSPGSVLQVTQSWQKYRLGQSVETNNVKSSICSLPPSDVNHQSKHVEVANEPLILRKSVNELCYEEPTFFQDVNVYRKPTHSVTKSASFSGGSVGVTSMFGSGSHNSRKVNTSTSSESKSVSFSGRPVSANPGLESHLFNPKKENTSPSSIPILRRPSEFKCTPDPNYTTKRILHSRDSVDSSQSKDIRYQRMLFHKTTEKPKYSTQEDRRLYLESTLKMFTDSLPKHDNSDFTLIPDYDGSSTKPRRISTGSMHEPTNWQSQTNIPVRVLVQKFSGAGSTQKI